MLPPFSKHALEQLIKPLHMLHMDRMPSLLPLDELSLRHMFLQVETTTRSDEMIVISCEDEYLGYAPRDVAESVGGDIVCETCDHLGDVSDELLGSGEFDPAAVDLWCVRMNCQWLESLDE